MRRGRGEDRRQGLLTAKVAKFAKKSAAAEGSTEVKQNADPSTVNVLRKRRMYFARDDRK